MQLYLQDQIINLTDLRQWAEKRLSHDDEDWIRDIALSILEWYDDKEFIALTTSGSTGAPKEIEHSKLSMRQSAEKTGTYFQLAPSMTALLCMPARYIAGKMMIIRALVLDMDLICVRPSLTPLRGLDRHVDFAALTPSQMESSLNGGADTSLIKKVILGGAPVSSSLQERLRGLNTTFYLTYGMTETITHVAARALNGTQLSDVFEALPGISFAEIDGRLVIVADHLDKSPLHTTDMVEIVNKNSFRWLGRADNVINSGGLKIHPESIEDQLKPLIKDEFLITGIPDPALGTQLILIIEGDASNYTNLNQVIAGIGNKYHRPKKIFFTEALERTPTGKIKRKLTVEMISKMENGTD